MVHKNILLSIWFYDALLLTSLLLLNLNGPLRQTVLRLFFHHWLRLGVAGIGDNIHSAFLLSFLDRLGDLASSSCLLAHCFDDTHSDRPSHVTHSKTAQGRTVREALDTRGLTRSHIDNGSNARFQGCRAIFQLFPRRTINRLQLSKLASSVSRVSVQHRCMSSTGLAWMLQNKPPRREASAFRRLCCHPPRCHDEHLWQPRSCRGSRAVPGKGFSGLHGAFLRTSLQLLPWLERRWPPRRVWEHQSPRDPQGQHRCHQLYRRPGGANTGVRLLGELVAGCNQSFRQGGSPGIAVLTGVSTPWTTMACEHSAPGCPHRPGQKWAQMLPCRGRSQFPQGRRWLPEQLPRVSSGRRVAAWNPL